MKKTFNLKNEFIERNDISDFLRENRVNSELYNIVMKHHGDQRPTDRQMTSIFNNAYRICTIATHRDSTMGDYLSLDKRLMVISVDIDSVRMVAWCLLRLHNGLIPVSEDIVRRLYERCRRLDVYDCCQNFVRNYAGDFDKPINFSGRAIVIESKNDMLDVEKEFMKNHSLFLDSIQQILRNNKELRLKMAEMEQKHDKEVEEFRTNEQSQRILIGEYRRELREKDVIIAELQKQVNNPRTIIKHIERPVPVETPESKVFSPGNLAKYAITLPKDDDANFLASVMRNICIRDRFFDNNVFDIIDSIQTERDKAKEEMEKKQQKKPSIIYNIDNVGQLNPAAETVENNYERTSVGRQFDDILTPKTEGKEDSDYLELFRALALHKKK